METNKAIDFMKINMLDQKCLNEDYSALYLEGLNQYVQILINETEFLNSHRYKRQKGEEYTLKYITFFGILGKANLYNRRFLTLCRYSVFKEARAEFEAAIELFEEITDRLDNAEKIWDKLTPQQKPSAEKAKKYLENIRGTITIGFSIVEDMEHFLKGEGDTLDGKNKTAIKLKEKGLLDKYIK